MVITYHGMEFFKITQGDLVIALNPISKKSKHNTTLFGSDVVMVSAHHPDFNGVNEVSRKDRQPFVVQGPGEYEVKDLFIKGYATTTEHGGSEILNTIYSFSVDGIRIVYLGAMSAADLPNDAKEELSQVDILITPIGGEGVLEASAAYKLSVKREPSYVVPMHYGDGVGEKGALKQFMNEGSDEVVKPLDKWTVKRKDVGGTGAEIVVLKES